MTPDQAERMTSAQSNNRELRMLKAVESIAGSLSSIHQELAMLSFRLSDEFDQHCLDRIAAQATVPPVEIVKK